MIYSYKLLGRKTEGKTLLERPRRKWEGSIEVDIKETDCEGMGWM
jgi:hypothetical protein